MQEDVKIAKDCYLPKSMVKFYASYSINAIQKKVRELSREKKTTDLTNGKRTTAVIFLVNGEAIKTNVSVDTLRIRMNQEMGEGSHE